MAPTELETELPRAVIKRMAKAALQGATGDNREYTLSKDALLAFSESTKVFIHYLTATANDICKESKRQTISAKDVLAALSDIEFDDFIEPLNCAVAEFKKGKAKGDSGRKSGKAGASKGEADEDGAAVAGGEEDGYGSDQGLGEDGDEGEEDQEEGYERAKRPRL
mmetsp:Transcript_35503/g.100498  ORF Transcript_35503/g.100498 Transcript_35503/m.100498 type:complete len:166 (-) Transcript_35503:122-619(-)|eukprot:CAMPEP_0117670878 /NCGR_PEP_ID=MMETSP0804-20121206/13016_1 /TAXON_ID=1074897 /ORGANISM="Tetraselmis astigmatica, Strain CCMP880" /LENGTH=165 /DNA_ID=CAMNT_0005479263 /DNA_START=102 /DNA_END=599 /DNA_ORIENTATION=+